MNNEEKLDFEVHYGGAKKDASLAKAFLFNQLLNNREDTGLYEHFAFEMQPRTERPVFTNDEILASFRKKFWNKEDNMFLNEKDLKKCLMSNQDKILNAITNSYPNRITRAELMCLTGLCDRIVRRNIEKLRHGDHWILSCSKETGYSITKDARVWDAFVDDWNKSNRFNMLKKTTQSELQMIMEGGLMGVHSKGKILNT